MTGHPQQYGTSNTAPALPVFLGALAVPGPLELHEKSALLDRITGAVTFGQRPVVFLVGSPISAPSGNIQVGVPDVSGMIDLVREALRSCTGKEPPLLDGYQKAFLELKGRVGVDEVNRVVRRAVLRSTEGASPAVHHAVLNGREAERDLACHALDNDASVWRLSPAVDYLGRLLASFPRLGKAILTTNFDPLIEISIRRAGGSFWRTAPTGDGSLHSSYAPGCQVIHAHGYWSGTEMLHTPTELESARPQLLGSLRRLLESSLLVVVAYGGWRDVFTRTLLQMVNDGSSLPEVIWTFFESDPSEIQTKYSMLIQNLRPGIERGGRVTLYSGIDCHEFFESLWNRLPQENETEGAHALDFLYKGFREDLERLVRRLQTFVDSEFAREAVSELESICSRHIRAGCRVAVLLPQYNEALRFPVASTTLGPGELGWLRSVSVCLPKSPWRWAVGQRLPVDGLPPAGMAGLVTTLAFGGYSVVGHFFVLHESPFSPAESQALSEVARALCSVIDLQMSWSRAREGIGRTGHLATQVDLGVVLPLASVRSLPQKPLPSFPGPVSLAASGVLGDIKRFVELRRLVARDGIRVSLDLGDLRLFVHAAVGRYLEATTWVNCAIGCVLPGSLPIWARFDRQALELAFTTFLRCAVDRSKPSSAPVVVVKSRGNIAMVQLQFTGTTISADLGRWAREDPRTLIEQAIQYSRDPVDSLGLAAAIVAAHGGSMSHRSQRVASAPGLGREYRVQLTISLLEAGGKKP